MLIGNIIQNCKDSQKELKMNELLIKLIKNIKVIQKFLDKNIIFIMIWWY